jgi:tetratricopeptide (TPR) repeat protein
MTHLLNPNRLRLAIATLLAFASTLVVLMLLNDDGRAPRAAVPTTFDGVARAGSGTDAEIARLQAAVRGGAPLEAQLAGAYLQKARETGDPGFYVRADGVLDRALARGGADPAELVEAAVLAAGRHDFDGALRSAERARALAPDSIAALPIMVDALVELGRYGDAERTLQRMVDLKPNLPAYARVVLPRTDGRPSGRRRGAAIRDRRRRRGPRERRVRAIAARLARAEPWAPGRGAARRAYAAALAAVAGYAPAAAGRARLAAREGDLRGAITRWRPLVARLPLPEYVTALGEAQLAAGRIRAGRRDLALVRVQRRLPSEAGVDTDVESVIYEADHGDKRRAVALARAARGRAPSVRSADALGWALTRAGRPRPVCDGRGGRSSSARWTRPSGITPASPRSRPHAAQAPCASAATG